MEDTMSDETTGRVFENTVQPDGSGVLDDIGSEIGKAAGDLLGGGASSGVDDWIKEIEARGPAPDAGDTGPRVWDEHIPDDMSGGGVMPSTLDPETAARQNAEQEASRQKAIADGVDAETAQIMYPDIDPDNPYKIN